MYYFDYDYDNAKLDAYFGYKPLEPMSFHVKMALLADQYDIGPSKERASKKFSSCLCVCTVAPQEAVNAVRLIYEAREALKDICISLVQCLVSIETAETVDNTYKCLEHLIQDIPALALDVARALGAVVKIGRARAHYTGFRCPGCKFDFAAPMNMETETRPHFFCPKCGRAELVAGWNAKFKTSAAQRIRDVVKEGHWWQK